MLKGIITKGIGGFYYIDTKDGVYECRARGRFRKEKIVPLVGDYVGISILDEKNKKGSLDEIFPRKNSLIRPRVSNVDQGVIVFAAKSPDISLDLLDRFIVLLEEQELDVLICINKIDLDEKEEYKEIVSLYENAGYKIIPISTYKEINIESIKEALKNKISVFAGPSGVGKSSILNSINKDFSLAIGELSAKIERGKHTTRHAELMEVFDDSFIVDSPGFMSLLLSHIKLDNLQFYFREFEPYLNICRFSGCKHVNEPDCAIKEQIGKEISEVRYKRYVSLFNEIMDERKNKI